MKAETHGRLMAATRSKCYFRHDVIPLFTLALASGARSIIELGTGSGTSTAALYAAAEELQAEFFTVDINPGRSAGRLPPEMAGRALVSSSWDPLLPQRIGLASVDFLFVDTSHKADQTKRELALWMPLLSMGGWAVFHDTLVCRAGVSDPIVAYMAAHPECVWRWTEQVGYYRCGLGLLRKMPSGSVLAS